MASSSVNPVSKISIGMLASIVAVTLYPKSVHAQSFERVASLLLAGEPNHQGVSLLNRKACVIVFITGYEVRVQEKFFLNEIDPSQITIHPHRGLFFIQLLGERTIFETSFNDGRIEQERGVWVPTGGFPSRETAQATVELVKRLYPTPCVGKKAGYRPGR